MFSDIYKAGEMLEVTLIDITAPRGLQDLAEWTRDNRLPAITGLIINKAGDRMGMPGGEFFKVYGQSDMAESWWQDQLRKAKSFDWSPYL
jgi:hypothetical protein